MNFKKILVGIIAALMSVSFAFSTSVEVVKYNNCNQDYNSNGMKFGELYVPNNCVKIEEYNKPNTVIPDRKDFTIVKKKVNPKYDSYSLRDNGPRFGNMNCYDCQSGDDEISLPEKSNPIQTENKFYRLVRSCFFN